MGKGAEKKMDSIPARFVVDIWAWEGLLHSEMQTMQAILKLIFAGSEEHWDELNDHRRKVIFYNQEYTKAILRMQLSQGKG
jgi:hypothetical protein